MERFKHWLSTKAYKRVKRYIFEFIVFFNIVIVLLGGFIIHISDREAYPSTQSGVWQIFTDILDPGFLSQNAIPGAEIRPLAVTVEVLVILICMITFTGAIIGYISNAITTLLDNSVTGPQRLYLKDHILILNWNNRAAGIIAEYLYTEKCEEVVVLSACDRNAVSKEIEDCIFEQGYAKYQKHVNFTIKQGEPFSYSELDKVCAKKAKTIIVLSDNNTQDGELRALKTVMMVSQMNQGRKDCAIVVETDSQNIYELVSRMQGREECRVVPAYLNKLLGKLMAHIVLQPQLNRVFAELFSHNGKEFYSVSIGDVAEITEDLSNDEIVDRFMQIFNKAIPLISSKQFADMQENKIFVLADKFSETLNRRTGKIPVKQLKLNEHVEPQTKEIIILGTNSKMKYMLNSFDAYMRNYGEDKLKIHFIGTEKALEDIPSCSSYITHKIKDRYDIMEIRKLLHTFDLSKMTTIAILSDDTVSSVEYDSGALISLIDINHELESLPKYERPEVVVEILNPKNHEIVQQYSFDNVVVSNKYISSMMAQLGDDDSIFEMIYDILTFDQEMDDFEQVYSNNDESRELYIEPVKDLFIGEVPEFSCSSELIRSIYESSNHKYIPIGIIHGKDQADFGNVMPFDSDLDKPEKIKLLPTDFLIVFASEW